MQASAGHQPEVCCRQLHEEALARDARRLQSPARISGNGLVLINALSECRFVHREWKDARQLPPADGLGDPPGPPPDHGHASSVVARVTG